MKRVVFCSVVACMLLIGSLSGAQTLVLYDNFEGKTLDPDKWLGSGDTGSGMTTLELSRLIKNDAVLKSKALSLSSRCYANTGSDSGVSVAHNGIVFADGGDIVAIEATVLVKKIQLPECSSRSDVEPFDIFVRLRIGGTFFNAGPRTPGSYLNDIFAWIGVGLATPGDNVTRCMYRIGRRFGGHPCPTAFVRWDAGVADRPLGDCPTGISGSYSSLTTALNHHQAKALGA